MKNLLLFIILLPLWGCDIVSSFTGSNAQADGCPKQPQALDPSKIEEVQLGAQPETISGQLRSGDSRGYTFAGKAKQKLSFRTEDDICIWIYTPNNDLLEGQTLPVDGTYIAQVSVPKGSTSFNLVMGFGDLQAASPASASPAATSASPSSPPPNVSQPVPSPNAGENALNQDQAASLVQAWLDAKSKIFASPFDRNLASQYTTGILYNDITKPNGSIDWLRNNNSYYTYSLAKVDTVWSFNPGSQPSLKVKITEDRTLYGRNGIDSNQSGRTTSNFTYFFAQDGGSWKISDYTQEN